MFGLTGRTVGDPVTTEMEAIDAVVRGDGARVDELLAALSVRELQLLAHSAGFLADCCEMASRSRR